MSLDIADEIARNYRPPRYDPFEIFHPSKAFLKDVIKQLRNQCYELLSQSEHIQFDPIYPHDKLFVELCTKPQLEKLNRRIREYQYRLRPISGNSAKEITQDTIQRAKELPIQDYFGAGQLRRVGNTLIGKCPLCNQQHRSSFTIYRDQNTFHCFSCGAGRDIIDFVMKTQNLTFIQTIKCILNLK